MVVSVEVDLRKMLMSRQVGLLVIERSRKLTWFVDSIVGFSLLQCRTPYAVLFSICSLVLLIMGIMMPETC